MYKRFHGIRFKIFVLMFICIFIPSVLMTALTFARFKTGVKNNTEQSMLSGLETSVYQLETSLKSVVNISALLSVEDDVKGLCAREDALTADEIIAAYRSVRSRMSFYADRIRVPNIMKALDSFYLYLPAQDMIMTSDSTFYENVSKKMPEEDAYINNSGFYEWYGNYPINYYSLTDSSVSQSLITYKIPIQQKNKTVGVLFINVKKEIFDNVQPLSGTGASTLLVSADGGEIYATDGVTSAAKWLSAAEKSSNESSFYFTPDGGSEKLAVLYHSSYSGFGFIAAKETSDVFRQVNETLGFIIFLVSCSLVLILVLTYLLTGIFYKPLNKILLAMNEIGKRNLDYRITEQRKDEFVMLYSGYNNMVDELKTLIDNLSTEKSLNKEAKIKLMQEQLNPHFLYNTLDSVYSLIKLDRPDNAAQMVSALSRFFRLSLSAGKDTVNLTEAVGIAQSYLEVQKIRFGDRFDYSFDVPKELSGCLVPKLVLQPFVENALQHGIENSPRHGVISVCAKNPSKTLLLIVKDNGVGMEPEKAAQLNEMLKGGVHTGGENFAMANVNTQLKLKYGEEYGITFESGKDGTSVYLSMPLNY